VLVLILSNNYLLSRNDLNRNIFDKHEQIGGGKMARHLLNFFIVLLACCTFGESIDSVYEAMSLSSDLNKKSEFKQKILSAYSQSTVGNFIYWGGVGSIATGIYLLNTNSSNSDAEFNNDQEEINVLMSGSLITIGSIGTILGSFLSANGASNLQKSADRLGVITEGGGLTNKSATYFRYGAIIIGLSFVSSLFGEDYMRVSKTESSSTYVNIIGLTATTVGIIYFGRAAISSHKYISKYNDLLENDELYITVSPYINQRRQGGILLSARF